MFLISAYTHTYTHTHTQAYFKSIKDHGEKVHTCADHPGLLGPKTPYGFMGQYKNRKKKSSKAKAGLNKTEALGPKYQAGEHASEAAKLKSFQARDQVPLDRLVKLQSILSRDSKDGGNKVDDARLL